MRRSATTCPECGRTVGVQTDAINARRRASGRLEIRTLTSRHAVPEGVGSGRRPICAGSRRDVAAVAIFEISDGSVGRKLPAELR